MNEIWFVEVVVTVDNVSGPLLLVQHAKTGAQARELVTAGLDKIVRAGVTFKVAQVGGVMEFASKLAAGGIKS